MIPREPEQGEGLCETKLLVKQHRWLKYLPTLANTNIYAGSRSQGRFFLPDVLNVSLSVQNWERALPSLAGSFSRPLDALTYLANLAVNGFFSADCLDFPAFPDNPGQGGRTNVFFLQPNHCHTWPTLAAKEDDLGSSLSLGSAQGRRVKHPRKGRTLKTPRLIPAGCSPFLGTFHRLE